jgi:hypothetical protein
MGPWLQVRKLKTIIPGLGGGKVGNLDIISKYHVFRMLASHFSAALCGSH